MDILTEWVAPDAFHNSDEYDTPKCHPQTRVTILNDIMRWVDESDPDREDLILWFYGPAGAGKSALAKRITEIAAEKELLAASFAFSKTVAARNTKDHLIPTLAYQLALSIPETRTHIEDAIEKDPSIFKKDIQTQIHTLLGQPFRLVSSTLNSFPKLIVIDGLDECDDSKVQVGILDAISLSLEKHDLPFIFLIASRPEDHFVTSFNSSKPLKSMHRRLALDDTYHPNSDIRLFFVDRFEHIKRTHPLKASIPTSWPTEDALDVLVRKASGQFIYAATVVKFIESIHHQPAIRLEIILGIPQADNEIPFASLDALYSHILSGVADIQLTLRVLGAYVAAPAFLPLISELSYVEKFLSLGNGDIQLALIDLPSIVSYDPDSVQILHASLADFLLDRRRSTIFYIDMAAAKADATRCGLRYCKTEGKLDGIKRAQAATNFFIFMSLISYCRHALMGPEFRSDLMNFDFEAFIRDVIHALHGVFDGVLVSFVVRWMEIIHVAELEERDKQEVLDQCHTFLQSQLQVYQSDPRLRLLVILTHPKVNIAHIWERKGCSPGLHREIDILLGLDNESLRLTDTNALDLRYTRWIPDDFDTIADAILSDFSVDGDDYASATLHCMLFLCNPRRHCQGGVHSEMNVTYEEWKRTCSITFELLSTLLDKANASPELVEFLSSHDSDIHTLVKETFSVVPVREVETHILTFLSRATVCVNWRIISAIQHASIADQRQLLDKGREGASPENYDDPENDDDDNKSISDGADCDGGSEAQKSEGKLI